MVGLDAAIHIYNILTGKAAKEEETWLLKQAIAVPPALAPWRLEELAALARPARVAKGEKKRVLQRLV